MRENDDEEGGYYSDVLDRQETAMTRQLGNYIGYGRVMNLARDIWREMLDEVGIAGGELSIGPCVSMTVPCECTDHTCDWCCGSGWLTPHVKAIKDADLRGICKCGATMTSEQLDNGITHKYCPKCHAQDYVVED